MPRNPWSTRSVPENIHQAKIHLLLPQPSKSGSESMVAQRAAVGQLVELGHSVFHKFGRLQDEWVCILPIVIHRILTQYQDIQNYKKVSCVSLLSSHLSCHRESSESWSILWAGTPVGAKRLDQSLFGHHHFHWGTHHCNGSCSTPRS